MPYHFYDNGQTIKDFDTDFWIFRKVLIVEIQQEELIIKDMLIEKLHKVEDKNYDILIVKTGICHKRDKKDFWDRNYGFHPDVYDFLISKFKSIRVLGFDSISVSSIQDRMLGREAHKRFLNPKLPILLLEDMDLREVTEQSTFSEILVSPLRIAECDGLPCTVFGKVDD
jgi:kynurenine formamidase